MVYVRPKFCEHISDFVRVSVKGVTTRSSVIAEGLRDASCQQRCRNYLYDKS